MHFEQCNKLFVRTYFILEQWLHLKRISDSLETTAEGCCIERFRIISRVMRREIKAAVVVPPEYGLKRDKKYPVLYTLHGARFPYDAFAKMSHLRKEQKETPFIYTCFDADDCSLYLDAATLLIAGRGDSSAVASLFTTFFFKEFMPALDAWYNIDTNNRALTGFSMGGFGAFHYMLCQPEMFTAVSGLSTVYYDGTDPDVKRRALFARVMGSRELHLQKHQALDHYIQLQNYIDRGVKIPPIYQHCGASDYLIEQNRKMAFFAQSKKLDFTFRETPGKHAWRFWHPAVVGIAAFHWKHFSI